MMVLEIGIAIVAIVEEATKVRIMELVTGSYRIVIESTIAELGVMKLEDSDKLIRMRWIWNLPRC